MFLKFDLFGQLVSLYQSNTALECTQVILGIKLVDWVCISSISLNINLVFMDKYIIIYEMQSVLLTESPLSRPPWRCWSRPSHLGRSWWPWSRRRWGWSTGKCYCKLSQRIYPSSSRGCWKSRRTSASLSWLEWRN